MHAFVASITRFAITTATTNHSATSTTFSIMVVIIVVATVIPMLFSKGIINIIIFFIIKYFIFSIVTMLSNANLLAFSDMHVFDGAHICITINAICYFTINFVPVKGIFMMNVSKIDCRVLARIFFFSIRSVSTTAAMALVTIIITIVVVRIEMYFDIIIRIL
jgi:hypothetical protein